MYTSLAECAMQIGGVGKLQYDMVDIMCDDETN